MTADRAAVRDVVEQFLRRANKDVDALTDDTPLYGDGLGLDSLEAAELSALLEDSFGTDPFTASDRMPETLAEILAFYEAAPTA
ncbi:MAG: acyl carrier protein [Jatrophihabitans sp.]|uniref:acyl carrier protein n=1 Tax=Jatrophihabitans sp. TaxID=1932789 RepID=UPI003F806398